MDPWGTGRPDVSHNRGGTGMSIPQPDPVRWTGADDGRTPQSQDQFTSMEVNSLAGQEIVNAVYGSYIDTSYKNQWNVDGIVCIHNLHLLRAYGEKLRQMQLQQRYLTTTPILFCCVASDKALCEIAQKGCCVQPTGSNYLGDSMDGVFLTTHADIQLKESKSGITQTLVMFQVALGNCRLIADIDVQEERIAISPAFDCHRFAVGPNTSQTISEQASRNQVFLFDFVSAGVTSSRPRQVLPICAIKLRKTAFWELELSALESDLTTGGSVSAAPAELPRNQPTQQTLQSLSAMWAGVPSAPSNVPPIQSGVHDTPMSHPSFHYNVRNLFDDESSLRNQRTLPAGASALHNQQHHSASQSRSQIQQHSMTSQARLPIQQNYVATQSELLNQKHPSRRLSEQNQQYSLPVQSRIEQTSVVVPPELSNQQHPVDFQSVKHNQHNTVFIQPGLQNQRNPAVIQTGLSNQQYPVAFQSELHAQYNPMVMQSRLHNQQHYVVKQTSLPNHQHPVTTHSAVQNQQHSVVVRSGRQNILHPFSNQTEQHNVWNQVANQGGQQIRQSPMDSQAVVQNMLYPVPSEATLRYVLRNTLDNQSDVFDQQNNVTIQSGLRYMQNTVVNQSGLQNVQNTVVNQSGLQNVQNSVVNQSGLQSVQNSVVNQSGLQSVQNSIVNQSGLQNLQSSVVNQSEQHCMRDIMLMGQPDLLTMQNVQALRQAGGSAALRQLQRILQWSDLSSRQAARQASHQPPGQPSRQLSDQRSCQQSGQLSGQLSSQLTGQPSSQPSCELLGQTSGLPSRQPSGQLSSQLSCELPGQTSGLPSGQPLGQLLNQTSSQTASHRQTNAKLTSMLQHMCHVQSPSTRKRPTLDRQKKPGPPKKKFQLRVVMTGKQTKAKVHADDATPVAPENTHEGKRKRGRPWTKTTLPCTAADNGAAVSRESGNISPALAYAGMTIQSQSQLPAPVANIRDVSLINLSPTEPSEQSSHSSRGNSAMGSIVSVSTRTALPDIMSHMGLGMTLPTIIASAETESQRVHTEFIQPIIIQPISDVMHTFVKATSMAIEPVSASISCDVENTSLLVSGQHSSSIRNPSLCSLLVDKEHESKATTESLMLKLSPNQSVSSAMAAQDPEKVKNDETVNDTETAKGTGTVHDIDRAKYIDKAQHTGTTQNTGMAQDTDIKQDTDNAQDTDTKQDTNITSTCFAGNIIGTVTEVVPGSSTHERSSPPGDTLAPVPCDIDSGKELLPALEVDEGDASTQGSTSQVESGVEKTSKEVSRICVHENETVELVVERRESSSSDADCSCIGSDSLPHNYEPCHDKGNWKRFMTNARFQPVVMLDRLGSMSHGSASSDHSTHKVTEEQKTDGEMCPAVETQIENNKCTEDAACYNSVNDAQKANAAKRSVHRCLNAAHSTEDTDEEVGNFERQDLTSSVVAQYSSGSLPGDIDRMDHSCSTATQNEATPCPSENEIIDLTFSDEDQTNTPFSPSEVEVIDLTCSTAAQNNSKLCTSGRLDESNVYPTHGVVCRHLMSTCDKSRYKARRNKAKKRRLGGGTRCHKALRNVGIVPTSHTAGKQENPRKTNSCILEDISTRDITSNTASDEDQHKTVGINHCNSLPKTCWLLHSLPKPAAGSGGQTGSSSDTGQEINRGDVPVEGKTAPTDMGQETHRGDMSVLEKRPPPDMGQETDQGDVSAVEKIPSDMGQETDQGGVSAVEKIPPSDMGQQTDRGCVSVLGKTPPPDTGQETHRGGMSAVGKTPPSDSGQEPDRGYVSVSGKRSQSDTGQETNRGGVSLVGETPGPPSDTGQETDRGGLSDMKTMCYTVNRCLENISSSHSRAHLTKCSGLVQYPALSRDSNSGVSAFNSTLSPHVPSSNSTKPVHNTPSHESRASLTAWHRPTPQHAFAIGVVLQGQEQRKPVTLAGKESQEQSLAVLKARSGNGNGHEDLTAACGQTNQSGALDKVEIRRVVSLNTYRQRRQDSNVASTGDPWLANTQRRSPVDGSSEQESRSVITHNTVAPQTNITYVSTKLPGTPTYVDVGIVELSGCETERSGAGWEDLIHADQPYNVWNTSDFCVASSTVSKILEEYSCKPTQEQHQVRFAYLEKLNKILKQISDDEMFSDNTSANISSTSGSSSTRAEHNTVRLKTQLKRQKLFTILAEINASVIADKANMTSKPWQDKEIHRRVERSRVHREITNERLGQLNIFHMDWQIQVLPQIFRLCSELEKCVSVEGQFLFLKVRPIPLCLSNELYALKMTIQAVYEELSLVSELAASDSRKDRLILALGWLHTERRTKLTQICYSDVQQVCELTGVFMQRRAWYRKMQAELQNSSRESSAAYLSANPMEYLAQKILSMTIYLDFIHKLQFQKMISCVQHPAYLDNNKDGFSACSSSRSQPGTLPQESTTKRLDVARSTEDEPVQASVKPALGALTRSSRDTTVGSDGRTKAQGSDSGERCSDKTHTSEVCQNKATERDTDTRVECVFSGRSDLTSEDIGRQIKDNKEDNKGDMPTGSGLSEDGGIVTASSERHSRGNVDDVIDGECKMPKGSGHTDERDAMVFHCEDRLHENGKKQLGGNVDDVIGIGNTSKLCENPEIDNSTAETISFTSSGGLTGNNAEKVYPVENSESESMTKHTEESEEVGVGRGERNDDNVYSTPANTYQSSPISAMCFPEASTDPVYYTNCSVMGFHHDEGWQRLETCYKHNEDSVYYTNCSGQGIQSNHETRSETLQRVDDKS